MYSNPNGKEGALMGGSWTKVELIQGKTIVEGQLNNMHTSMIGSVSETLCIYGMYEGLRATLVHLI